MRKWFQFHRDLGLQLFALYLLLVVPFLVTLVIFDRLVGIRIRADVEANDLALVRAIALETDRSVNDALQTVQQLSRYPEVIQSDNAAMEDLFSIVAATRPDVNLVYRLDANGIMTFHYPIGPSSTVGTDFSFREYFKRALQTDQPLISEGRVSPTTNQAVATAVMPIRSADGTFLGVVATNIRLESLSQTLSAIAAEHSAEEGFEVTILDDSGKVIAHPNPTLLLKPASELLPKGLSRTPAGIGHNTLITTDPQGQQRLYTQAFIPRVGWSVLVSRPTASAFGTQIFLERVTQVAAATFVLIGLFFWGMLSRRIINPIERLAPVSEAIGQNKEIEARDRDHIEKQARRKDQIGNLTRSILQMETAIAERMKEHDTLLDTSTAVVSSLDLSIVLDRILEQVERLMNVRMSAIIARDEVRGEFRIRASRGLSKSFTEELAIQPTEPGSVTMRALNAREPIQVSDTETDPSYISRRLRARAEGYRSILAVPLTTQHAPPTALLVFDPGPRVFTHNELQLLSNFANHATMAIENAVLFERSDMRLQEQTRRLEALVQSLHDGLVLSDPKGKVIYANRRVMELAELDTSEQTAMRVDGILARIIRRAVESENNSANLKNVVAGDKTSRAEISLLEEGHITHLRLETFNVTDRNGIAIGRGLILHDITADRELDRMKSSLVSTVSHELRTPLAAIKGYASTLLADDVTWDPNSQREFLTIISDETDRLTALVNNLLDLSRIEAGSLRLSMEKCNLKEIAQRAAKQASLQATNRFEAEVQPRLPNLMADAPRLETILRNLIENSVKYGGAKAHIRLTIGRESGSVVFRVSDDGPGIPPEERQRVFESFYRVDDSLTRVASGAGLGLAICQGLVHAHGGTIWIEDQQKGTCIAFSIPIKSSTRTRKKA